MWIIAIVVAMYFFLFFFCFCNKPHGTLQMFHLVVYTTCHLTNNSSSSRILLIHRILFIGFYGSVWL